MSFTELNYYFIRTEIQGKLGRLPLNERWTFYSSELRSQSLKRLREAYGGINEFPNKLRFYREAIEALGTYEADFLVWSIYHEPEADVLITELDQELALLVKNVDKRTSMLLQMMVQRELIHDGSRLKGCLKTFFVSVVDVSESQWVLEDEKNNPVMNEFLSCLFAYLSSGAPDVVDIELLILHYNRLWMLYYAIPFSFPKGILLLDKLDKRYMEIDPLDFKVDLVAVLESVGNFSRSLLPSLADVPFIDLIRSTKEMIRQSAAQSKLTESYWSRIGNLSAKLEMDRVYQRDLSKSSFVDLITRFAYSSERSGGAYLAELERRRNAMVVPSSVELLQVPQLVFIENSLQPEMLQLILSELIERNYVFFIKRV